MYFVWLQFTEKKLIRCYFLYISFSNDNTKFDSQCNNEMLISERKTHKNVIFKSCLLDKCTSCNASIIVNKVMVSLRCSRPLSNDKRYNKQREVCFDRFLLECCMQRILEQRMRLYCAMFAHLMINMNHVITM